MAGWAWRHFRVSVFAWLVTGAIAHRLALLLTLDPDRTKMETSIKALQSQTSLGPQELWVYWTSISTLFPLLSTLGFGLVALGELAHLGPRIGPSYEPPRTLKFVYCLRHAFGMFAIICAITPSIAFYFGGRALP